MQYTYRILILITIVMLIGCNETYPPGHVTPPDPPYKPRTISMKEIPAGTFLMGADDYSAATSQRPVHPVTLNGFLMQETEVTQGQYVAIMGVNPSHIQFSNEPEDREAPVEQVSWYDAALFCNRLSQRDTLDTVYLYKSIIGIPGNSCQLESLYIDYSKKGYRLPTEAEWEYACRGGTTTFYWWGDNPTGCETRAWYAGNIHVATAQVATKARNQYGLYDMTGNVWEWCNDWYARYDSSAAPQTNPTGPSMKVPGNGKIRRGGSWYDGMNGELRSAYRAEWGPDGGNYFTGFRVVRPK